MLIHYLFRCPSRSWGSSSSVSSGGSPTLDESLPSYLFVPPPRSFFPIVLLWVPHNRCPDPSYMPLRVLELMRIHKPMPMMSLEIISVFIHTLPPHIISGGDPMSESESISCVALRIPQRGQNLRCLGQEVIFAGVTS